GRNPRRPAADGVPASARPPHRRLVADGADFRAGPGRAGGVGRFGRAAPPGGGPAQPAARTRPGPGGHAAREAALPARPLLPAGHLPGRAGADLLPGLPDVRIPQPQPGAAMTTPWRLVRRDGGATVAARLEIADGAWSRFKGLQFRA